MGAGPVVWITRTKDGATATARAVEARGFTPLIAPVLNIRPLRPVIDPHAFDALIVTSRNGLKAFSAICSRRAVTVWCVGDATAQTARQLGFQHVLSARGDVQALSARIRAEADHSTRFFYAAALEPAWPLTATLQNYGFTVSETAVYETVEIVPDLPDPAGIDYVLVHSARGGAAAVRALDHRLQQRPDRAFSQRLTFICISQSVWQATAAALAMAAPPLQKLAPDPAHHRISAFPDGASMLEQLVLT
ncbi:uroporphyrinogen-III synthase [Asticcacaulis sp. EMRT-3]|uniref:uroporphyrinogen-III synthase n=1 Tax=Asticcacaulis sp. EMRT-3 TaxID=3040349 RepID=UPI0024AF5264|nr:uroporphyrinogen-III synthase [Asticcacaulis sp. EMRT-3]MDI7776157.1 uroporphyrinogen-III synthase [Asticcacaulis sp. EMRT-3]